MICKENLMIAHIVKYQCKMSKNCTESITQVELQVYNLYFYSVPDPFSTLNHKVEKGI